MRKGDKTLFKDKQMLCNMLNLRVAGWATTSLALLYSCDRSSIEFQCNKFGAKPGGEVFTLERIIRDILTPSERDSQWRITNNGERINLGRSYKDYLRLSS